MTYQPHNGGPCPVHPNSLVRVKIRAANGSKALEDVTSPAKNWIWTHNGGPGDIVAFEQTGELA